MTPTPEERAKLWWETRPKRAYATEKIASLAACIYEVELAARCALLAEPREAYAAIRKAALEEACKATCLRCMEHGLCKQLGSEFSNMHGQRLYPGSINMTWQPCEADDIQGLMEVCDDKRD